MNTATEIFLKEQHLLHKRILRLETSSGCASEAIVMWTHSWTSPA